MNEIREQTIQDFGAQWCKYRENEGYYASVDLLQDILGPLMSAEEIRGKNVADIGSGTGRIVNMLLDAGAGRVTAVEPSSCFSVLRENTSEKEERICYQNVRGDEFCASEPLDFVFSFGVVHHIPDPKPVMEAIYNALKPGARVVLWLYGKEGNELYLAFATPLRALTVHLPQAVLRALCWGIYLPLCVYFGLCKIAPLPLRDYLVNHLFRLRRSDRILTIHDQLNPAYAKYYTKQEAIALLADAGFSGIETYHRHGYSWTVAGRKPGS